MRSSTPPDAEPIGEEPRRAAAREFVRLYNEDREQARELALGGRARSQ